ncbi:MAG: hypothetical protein ABW149_11865, partial [Sedimenticola sp.]
MKIRTRVRMIILIPILFGMSVTIIQQWMAQRVDAAYDYDLLVSQIVQNTSSLYHLGAEFIRYPGESRARKQWLGKHKALASLMFQADLDEEEVVDLLGRMQQSHAELWELYRRFFAVQTDNTHPTRLTKSQDRIADQLFMVTQNMTSDALALGRFSAGQVVGVRDLQDRLIIVFTL